MSNRLLAGRYELLEKIGDGGMAVVYKAKDKLLNRYIAIKILRPEFTKDETFVENFKRESQAAAGLSHPNIVGVYDVGKEGNINYIVMELVDGRTLNEIIAEQAPMDYRSVIDISKQVADALKIAHKNKIIHRDVKPHNIMITEEGIVKLADFGIAKAVNDATLSTGSKVIGSVHYFSPEQARGNYVDERSDIYSLGIVMYEMLTGRVPFDGDNPVTIALKHINEEIVPPSEYVSGIPPQLERAVLKATSKFQTNRYNNVEELIEELNNIDFVTKVVGDKLFADASNQVEKKKKKDQEPEPEDDEIASKSKKNGKGGKKKIGVIVAVIVLLLAAIGVFAAWKLGAFSDTATVPDLTDMTIEQATEAAEEAGFKIKEGKEIYSNDISEGRVAEQDPKAKSTAKKGATITVNLSMGSKDGTVPNLIGMKYNRENISRYLEERGYELGEATPKTSTEPEGTILDQDPSGGTEAEKGTAINVVYSDGKGKETAAVPSVVGMSVDEATAAIEAAGFDVGKVTYEESNNIAAGYITWQQYAANTQLDKGTKINIEVSKGPPQTNPTDDEGNDDQDENNNSGNNNQESGNSDNSGNNQN